MNFLGVLQKLLKPLIPKGYGWQSATNRYNHMLNLQSVADQQVSESPETNSVVAAATGWIRDQLGKVRLEVVSVRSDGIVTPQYRHQFLEVWHNPSDDCKIDATENLEQLITDWITRGNAYLQKIRSQSGRVVGFRTLAEWRVEPRWSWTENEWIGYYEVDLDGTPIFVAPSEIVHFRDGRHPLNERKGRSRLEAGIREIQAHNKTVEYTRVLAQEGGVVGVVFSKPSPEADPIGEAAAAQLKNLVRSRQGNDRFDPVVIDTDVRANTWGLSPEQMRMDRIPLNLELAISALIGISPKVYGGAASQLDSTYANNKEAKEGAWSRLAAILGRFGSALTTQCLRTDFGGDTRLEIRFNLDAVEALQEQVQMKVERAMALFGTSSAPGICTRNECREMVGLDALPPQVGDRFADGRDLAGNLPATTPATKDPELFT